MLTEVFADADEVALRAALRIASAARSAVEARGHFVLAVSGGRTPWQMLRNLASQPLPWSNIQIVQVDERFAPAGDPDRNLTHLEASLLEHSPVLPEQLHAMPVELADLSQAAAAYARTLEQLAGTPPVLDMIHLGLGADGHTASLVPGDAVLDVLDSDVAVTGEYQGHRRMTLTYSTLNRARSILWVVTGSDKAQALAKLCRADGEIPAGRVNQKHAMLLADRAAASGLTPRNSNETS